MAVGNDARRVAAGRNWPYNPTTMAIGGVLLVAGGGYYMFYRDKRVTGRDELPPPRVARDGAPEDAPADARSRK